jgi:hypothetical protein
MLADYLFKWMKRQPHMIEPDFPSEHLTFGSLLDAQPAPIQAALEYCLALLMVERGQVKLIGHQPGEAGPISTFRTKAGNIFTLAKPPLGQADEAAIREVVRQMLDADGEG